MKIVWALDPFESETRPDPLAIRELREWHETAGAEIRPVYVLQPDIPIAHEMPGIDLDPKDQIRATQFTLRHYLKDLDAEWTSPPAVIYDRSPTAASAVQRLLAFARLEGAKLIVVSSHGRRGLSRLLLGSFAEQLLNHSDIPLLFLSHAPSENQGRERRPLFATDFSSYTLAAFEEFLESAGALFPVLTIFHQLERPPTLDFGGISANPMAFLPTTYWDDQEKWAREQADAWVKRAEAKGITARAIVVPAHGRISENILEAARTENACLVAMASRSGPVESMLLGSVARGVSRPHSLPVWVCGRTLLELRAEPTLVPNPVISSGQEVS